MNKYLLFYSYLSFLYEVRSIRYSYLFFYCNSFKACCVFIFLCLTYIEPLLFFRLLILWSICEFSGSSTIIGKVSDYFYSIYFEYLIDCCILVPDPLPLFYFYSSYLIICTISFWLLSTLLFRSFTFFYKFYFTPSHYPSFSYFYLSFSFHLTC